MPWGCWQRTCSLCLRKPVLERGSDLRNSRITEGSLCDKGITTLDMSFRPRIYGIWVEFLFPSQLRNVCYKVIRYRNFLINRTAISSFSLIDFLYILQVVNPTPWKVYENSIVDISYTLKHWHKEIESIYCILEMFSKKWIQADFFFVCVIVCETVY